MFLASFAWSQNNIATVIQTGTQQTANVTQTGSQNLTDVNQYAESSSYGPGAQDATVIQDGNNNKAYVDMDQTGGGGKTLNTAYIEQIGDLNISNQKVNAPSSNSGQNVWGYQAGTENVLNQTINGGYTEYLHAEQYGFKNEATQTANATHTYGEIYQDGNENYAIQDLKGSNNGYQSARILIDQYGSYNDAYQDFTGHGSSHKNNAEVYQTGDHNLSNQFGDGRDLSSVINQTGDWNQAFSTQNGEGHSNIITQTGSNNIATVTQN